MSGYSKPFIGGSLRPNKFKTAPGHPDVRGDMTFSDEMITHLINMQAAGMTPRLDLSAWKKTDKNGNAYMSINAQPDRRDIADLASRGGARQSTPDRQYQGGQAKSQIDLDDDVPF